MELIMAVRRCKKQQDALLVEQGTDQRIVANGDRQPI